MRPSQPSRSTSSKSRRRGKAEGKGGLGLWTVAKGDFIFGKMGGIRCMGKDKDAALHNGVM